MNLMQRDGRLVGFRPENVRVVKRSEHGDGASAFPCRVIRIENLGSDRYVYVSVKDDAGESKLIAKLAISEVIGVQADDEADLLVEKRFLRFFDRDTGESTAA